KGPPKGANLSAIEAYPILASTTGSSELVERSRSVLKDAQYPGGNLMCGEFQPGFAIRFEQGKEKLDVLLCFLCGEVVFWNGRTARQIPISKSQFWPLAAAVFPSEFKEMP